MSFLDILLSLLILSAISLIIYLIIWLKNVGKIVDSLNSDVRNIHDKAIPLIENLTKTSKSASKITSEAENYLNEISSIVDLIIDKISWLKNRQHNLTQKSDSPGGNLILNLRAIIKGVSAFLKHL